MYCWLYVHPVARCATARFATICCIIHSFAEFFAAAEMATVLSIRSFEYVRDVRRLAQNVGVSSPKMTMAHQLVSASLMLI